MCKQSYPPKISAFARASVSDRYNITNYDDLVDAGRKIREGRERIEQQSKEFSHRRAAQKAPKAMQGTTREN
jgi:hypothetical protein